MNVQIYFALWPTVQCYKSTEGKPMTNLILFENTSLTDYTQMSKFTSHEAATLSSYLIV